MVFPHHFGVAAPQEALSVQMAELRDAQLGWQQNVLSERLTALKQDSERIAANDLLKVSHLGDLHRAWLV